MGAHSGSERWAGNLAGELVQRDVLPGPCPLLDHTRFEEAKAKKVLLLHTASRERELRAGAGDHQKMRYTANTVSCDSDENRLYRLLRGHQSDCCEAYMCAHVLAC